MLPGNEQPLMEKLNALADAFGAALPGKLDELEALARAMSGGGLLEEIRETMDEICRLAHTISGTAGTFGYHAVTEAARAIERSLRPVIEAGDPLTAEQAAGIRSKIEALKKNASEKPEPIALTDHIPTAGFAVASQDVCSTVRNNQEPRDSGGTAKSLPKVLVVDDDRQFVDAIAIALLAHGIEVLRAFSGAQGFKLARDGHPDAIITDYAMPDGSGEYLLGRLKDAEATRDIPVVVLTAFTRDGAKDSALERELVGRLGAVSYLVKPIGLDALVAELAGVLELPPLGSG